LVVEIVVSLESVFCSSSRRDDAPIIFARQLTAQGYFYLDKNDSRVLFEEIFEGIRTSLMLGYDLEPETSD
jgi:hypothetical protein